MRLISEGQFKKLVADDGKLLRDINDNGEEITEQVYNEETGEYEEVKTFIEPYRVNVIYLGKQIQTLEQAQELYVEEEE